MIEDETERPYTILMPNKLNFIVRLEWLIYMLLAIYVYGFPHLYLHMIGQRKKYYAKKDQLVQDANPLEDEDGFKRAV